MALELLCQMVFSGNFSLHPAFYGIFLKHVIPSPSSPCTPPAPQPHGEGTRAASLPCLGVCAGASTLRLSPDLGSTLPSAVCMQASCAPGLLEGTDFPFALEVLVDE